MVENRGYPTGPSKGQSPLGQIVLLEDTNRDGQYDKRTVFVDSLTFPNGVQPWKGGVYVTCAPYLYYFKDTDGDGKADEKEIVFQGFQDLSTTQLRVSHPTLAIDNWVYLTSGLTVAKVISPAWTNHEPVVLNRLDGRFRPGTTQIESTSGTAQYGQTFDAFGRRFICSNRNHVQHVVFPQRYRQRNPYLSISQAVEDVPDHGAACRLFPISANIVTAAYHGGYVTSACGLSIYNGTALPAHYRGNSFVCEPAANLIHRDVLVPNGVSFVAKRAFATNEFLASADNWFRPVNLAVGPDGALYICDMYRKTIEHPEYLPEAIREVTDFDGGKGMGRIYRVVGKSVKKSRGGRVSFPDLGKLRLKQLCDELENRNEWSRMTAHRLLLERADPTVVPRLRKIALSPKPAEARLHALYLLDSLGAITTEDVLKSLHDPHVELRRHALIFAERHLSTTPALLARVITLADDPDPGVRFQCALTLSATDDARAVPALVRILARDVEDKWTRTAVLTATIGREAEFYREWLSQVTPPGSLAGTELMNELGRILAVSQKEARLDLLLRELLVPGQHETKSWQLAAVAGFGQGLRSRRGGARESSELLTLANSHQTDLQPRLQVFFKLAAEWVGDPQRAVSDRLAAVNLLAEGDYQTSGNELLQLLAPQHPAEVQSAAIRALGRMIPLDKLPMLVERSRWQAYSPGVREVVFSILMSDAKRLPTLLAAIEADAIPAWMVNSERRNLLLRHKDPAIRTQADNLFKRLTPEDRINTFEQTKPVLQLSGNAVNGRTLFQQHCASCHTFAGSGHLVGPDLTGIRNQPAEAILLHIVVPEQEVLPIYTAYNVETRSGESYSGLLATESSGSITLRMAQGFEQQLARTEIVSLTPSRLSLMPQDFEKAMTPQQMADLLAFLKGQ